MQDRFRPGAKPGKEDEMRVRIVVLALATLCLTAWAADGAAIAERQATGLKPQVRSLETDAIAIPRMLSYQGKLTDTLGAPVPNGNYSVAFKLYTVPSGGSPFWSETQNVATKAGLFSVLLGSVTPIGAMPDGGAVYLGMAVAGGSELTPRLRIVSAAYAYKADTANYALASAGGGDNVWVRRASPNDSILWTVHSLGIARGGAGDTLIGSNRYTHVNLGLNSTTGTSGQDIPYCTVGGGGGNIASGPAATVGGGSTNTASGGWAFVGGGDQNTASDTCATVGGGVFNSAGHSYSTVGGGWSNTASGNCATVSGGDSNTASGTSAFVGGGTGNGATWDFATVGGGGINNATYAFATVGGGQSNTASGLLATVGGGNQNNAANQQATVAGGDSNTASGGWAFVGGGAHNTASSYSTGYSVVGGGQNNTASADWTTVGGGLSNTANGNWATVGGGQGDTATGLSSFAVGDHSRVLSGHDYSAAFTGSATIASNQVRAQAFSTGSCVFTSDHPLDPHGKLLNQYAMGSSEMVMFYRGAATIGGAGRVQVHLPDYFDAYTRNPMVQLTGVGTSDVYVAEKVAGNQFVIGGKPGTEVYWTVTGERKDAQAEIARILTPVEQPKTGALRGVMVDDDALVGTMRTLEQMGKAGEFSFRTAAGRQRYENMLKRLREAEQHKSAQPVHPRVERKQAQPLSQSQRLQQ